MGSSVLPSDGKRRAKGQLAALGLALGALGCASAPPAADQTVSWPNQGVPDWVSAGGRTPRLPDSRFVTGFGIATGADALDAAKRQAAADLASRLEVHIENRLSDVSEDRDGKSSYHVAAVTRSTVNLSLSGLGYEVHAADGRVYALAMLEREPAAEARRRQRDRAAERLRDCMGDARARDAGAEPAAAIEAYEDCRRPLSEALQHSVVVAALVRASDADDRAHRDLARARRELETRLMAVVAQPRSVRAAAESLALQLARQGLAPGDRATVRPFTYGTLDFSSSLGRHLTAELERALQRRASTTQAPTSREVFVTGVFFEDGDVVNIDATAAHGRTGGDVIASAGVRLPREALPPGLAVRPANYESAVEAQRLLSDGGVVTGDLRLDLWTSRGRKGIVLSEGDEYRLYLRINRPAWVRLIYVLQSGEQVPLEEAFYIGPQDVGRAVEYPHRFTVVPPFGVEHLYGTAHRERPPPLATRVQTIAGEQYTVVSHSLQSIARARGVRVERDQEIAESFVAITTAQRSSAP